MILRKAAGLGAVMAALALGGCQTNQASQLVLSNKSAVELRAMQTRAFDTTDRNKTLRAVIATLQDLGYTVEKVEPPAGTVTATKLATLRMTSTVYARGTTQLAVRSNAIVKLPGKDTQVDAPEFYQRLFFEPLSKAMFLSALQVEDKDDPPPSAEGKPADAAAAPADAVAPETNP